MEPTARPLRESNVGWAGQRERLAASRGIKRAAASADNLALVVSLKEVRFERGGRHYLTFSSASSEVRTDVSASTRVPEYAARDYELPLGADSLDLAFLQLRLTATQLLFSRGARDVGNASLTLDPSGGSVPVNGPPKEVVVLLRKSSGAAPVVGTVRLSWRLQDKAAAAAAEAESRGAAVAAVAAAAAAASRRSRTREGLASALFRS